ncbi:MAG TPA: molybdopterin-dependent oxidoreductase [Bryobacteraceae bacterium]|nr:molybdopterin-dependent oxidoreductase [Bryobacteraceae bacterium]
MSSALARLKRLTGLDTRQREYAYARGESTGYTSAKKIPDRWVATTCGYCSVGCGIEIGVKQGRAIASRPLASHPVNRGKLCPKGLSEHYILDAENRAKYPLLRKNGELARVTWDEALNVMVERLRAIQAKHGAPSLGVLSTGQLVTEEFYALGKLVQLGFGTNNYDGNTTLCMASAVSGYKGSFGSDGPPGCYEDLEKADVILLIGANIADNHPILCQYLDANPRKTLIVADPRVSKTAMMADLHLPLRPRSDLALANGLAHILIRHGLIDRDYIANHTAGFDELVRLLEAYPPERVSRMTGLSEELLYKTAFLYGRARAGFIGWTMGVNHSTLGTATVSALCNLALLTGNIGRAGAAPFSITGQCNAMGTREAGFTSGMPGYRKFDDAADRRELAALWGIEETRLPARRGLAYPDIIEAALAKKIRGLWIIATNPLVSFPNQDVLRQALSNLEFLVVQDGYHPTPTTELAHLVLPAAIWGEKEGTYTNSERRVSKVNRAVAPPGEARADFDIFLEIAERLGCRQELYPGWRGPEDAFNEWRRVSRGRLCDYSGITYQKLAEKGAVQWPFPEGQPSPARLYEDGKFPTADGRAKLVAAHWEPFPEQPNREFPLILNTGRTVEHWHTRTKTREAPILEHLSPRAWLEMNPRDAKQLGLRSHQRVDVVSQRGRVSGVELRLTEITAPGQVFMPFHFFETNVNEVTQSAFDPVSREPNYKQCAVRVEPSRARSRSKGAEA